MIDVIEILNGFKPIDRVKTYLTDRKTLKHIALANQEYIVKPFIHGSQLKTREFSNYLFVENTTENASILKSREFTDFKKSLGKKVTWELNDPMMDIGDVILYNESYNLMIVMVSEKIWNIFNKAINIGKKTKTDIETQREIIINVFSELAEQK